MAAVRPMRAGDIAAVDLVARAAFASMIPAVFVEDETVRARRGQRRIAHLHTTDPAGAWVAEGPDGRAVGAALALVREGVWGLSLLVVDPAHHGAGTGAALLEAALGHAAGTRGALILSSTSPAAMRLYARAGFDLRPCVAMAGVADATRGPTERRSRPGDLAADRAVVDRASRHVRGASHAIDVAVLLETGGRLLVCEDRGFAVHRDGSVVLLCALDEDTATDLLWSAWADGPRGGTVHLDFLDAGQGWAVRAGLEAGLAVSPEGPLFVRGDLGALTPFVPSGAYL